MVGMIAPDTIVVSFVGLVCSTLTGWVIALYRKQNRDHRERIVVLETEATTCKEDRDRLTLVSAQNQHKIGTLEAKVNNLENCPCGECPYRPPSRARKDMTYVPAEPEPEGVA